MELSGLSYFLTCHRTFRIFLTKTRKMSDALANSFSRIFFDTI